MHTGRTTPEIYFGYHLALPYRNYIANPEGFNPETAVSYMMPESLIQDKFHMSGEWYNGKDGMTLLSESGSVFLPYYAKEVNIVAANSATLNIKLDGNPISSKYAGSDVTDGIVEVDAAQLYNIISSSSLEYHQLEISTDSPGFEIFTFTFG